MAAKVSFTLQKHPILTWLVTSYVIFITVWLILRGLFFDRLWPLVLLNTIAEYLFVPLPLLLIIAVWQRHRSSLLGLSLPTIAFIILFGELLLPFPSSAKDNHKQTITAMSFNILYNNKAYGAIVGSIQAASPDLVGFQELTQTSAQEIIYELLDRKTTAQ